MALIKGRPAWLPESSLTLLTGLARPGAGGFMPGSGTVPMALCLEAAQCRCGCSSGVRPALRRALTSSMQLVVDMLGHFGADARDLAQLFDTGAHHLLHAAQVLEQSLAALWTNAAY